ncbi:MAG: T9SS type A sorting domain-containing protein [Chitinophagaceae bacterium]
MRNSKLFFLFSVLAIIQIVIPFSAKAQVLTPKYVSMTANTNGYYEYLPQGYNPSASTTYPVIITMHGTGEMGPGNSSSLSKLLNNGPIRTINQGKFPTSFTVNGQTFKFIVIAPQFTAWPQPDQINKIIDYVLSKYKADASRIYLTGLSMGGGATWEYAGSQTHTEYPKRLAAIAPVCGAAYPNTYKSKGIANANLPVWAFHNQDDPQVPVSYTNDFIKYISAIVPTINPLPRKTIFPVGGHDSWTKAYDPAYKENGKNVYEWMLGYKRGGVVTPPANVAPVVNAGADKTITLPAIIVGLSATASDADGSITSYAWKKVGGPSQFTLSSTTIFNPILSALVAGTYQFSVTVTDNKGATATDNINVIVKPIVVIPTPTANKKPTVGAGSDKTITMPVNSLQFAATAADEDGKITKYMWHKTEGPSAFKFDNHNSLNPKVTGLVPGKYTFRLTVTDDDNATANDAFVLTVLAAPAPPPVPVAKSIRVRIYGGTNPYNNSQWNNWNAATGSTPVKTSPDLKYSDGTSSTIKSSLSYSEAISDNSASFPGGVAPAEVLRYSSYATTNRTLTITGLATGKTYDLELYSSRNNTGNKTKFTTGTKTYTVSSSGNSKDKALFTSLQPDAQGKLQVKIERTATFNYINGFTLTEKTSSGTAKSGTPETMAVQAEEKQQELSAGLALYPNPTTDRIVLQLNNPERGNMKVQVIDMSGHTLKEYSLRKDQESTQSYLSLSDLKPGQYLIRIQVDKWIETRKITRL